MEAKMALRLDGVEDSESGMASKLQRSKGLNSPV